MALTGGSKAWLEVGNVRRYYGYDGAVVRYDVSYGHEVGNDDDTETRWVIGVGCSHPDFNKYYDELNPAPECLHGSVEDKDVPRQQVPFAAAALWAISAAKSGSVGCTDDLEHCS